MSEIRLGTINGSHGLQGWVKVYSYTDPVSVIFDYPVWTLRLGTSERQIKITESRVNGRRLIVQLDGIDTREQADALNGSEVVVPRETLPELEEGNFYWFQLHGMTVKNKDDVVYGQVDHLLETGANDVLVVKPNEDSIDDRERLIPFVEEKFIINIDQMNSEIIVDWDVDY